MSSKPSTPFSWASAGTRVAASAAKALVGFVVRERPPAQVLNDIFAQIGDWTRYLSDGALVGAHTIDGSLGVGGLALTVPSTVFTADNTTEIFTATGIDLQTGDGPLRVSTTTTLPSGLTAGTDYYAIRLTANTFKLATSFALAIAGTNLLIASNGTGVHSIVGFGATRPRDATVSRNLTVGGVTTANTLAVTASATIATLGVTGTATVATLAVSGNETVGGTLGVTGATTLASLGVTGAATVGTTLGVTGATTLASLGVTGAATVGTTLGVTGVITASGGLTTPSGVTFTGGAEEHHPVREFTLDCSDFQNADQGFAAGILNTTQGFIQTVAVDGSHPIVIQTLVVGSGNSTGSTSLVAGLKRIRVGDQITEIRLTVASIGTPNGGGTVELESSVLGTGSSETQVFLSGTPFSFPAAGTVTTVVCNPNYTHVTGSSLRLRVRTQATDAAGTPAIRFAAVKFIRP